MCAQGLLLSARLTGRHYRDILLYDLPELLEDAPQAVRARMWYMRDGALAHSSRAVRDAVSNTYYGGWTGTGGAIEWPPRSTPDLNPLELYLCGHLNALVYAAPVDNGETLHHHTVDGCQTIHNCPGVFARMRRCGHLNALVYAAPVDNGETLHNRTVDGCQTIHNCPGVFARMRRSMTRRVEELTESYKDYFEQVLLQIQRLNDSKHISVWTSSCFDLWYSCLNFLHTFQLHPNMSVRIDNESDKKWFYWRNCNRMKRWMDTNTRDE
jgi:hypothetical protein